MKGTRIQNRPGEFASGVMELCDDLPKTFAGRNLGVQLFRAATAGAANYPGVRGVESRNDFIHEVVGVHMDSNESLVCLRIVERREMVPTDVIGSLVAECDELCRIIAVSRKTAEENARLARKP